jgi:hypothetical protein
MLMLSITLSDISLDKDLQPRERTTPSVVDEYAEAMQRGESFPPVIVFDDGEHKWLADGFHRYYAAKKAGLNRLGAEFRTGTKTDALKFSLSANAVHGLKRSQADRRRAVLMALESFSDLSNREISKLVKVDDKTVGKYRARLGVVGEISQRIAAGESFVASHSKDLLFIFKLPGPYVRMFFFSRDSGGPHMIYDTRGGNLKYNKCHALCITNSRLDMTDFESWTPIPNPQNLMQEILDMPGDEVARPALEQAVS